MEDLPFSAGLQIIDADQIGKGAELVYVTGENKPDFDSLSLIDRAFDKFHGKTDIH